MGDENKQSQGIKITKNLVSRLLEIEEDLLIKSDEEGEEVPQPQYDVEIRVMERGRVAQRRTETFAPTDHEWRRNINSAARYKPDDPRSRNYLEVKKTPDTQSTESLESDESIAAKGHWGVNVALEYFGMESDVVRTEFLRRKKFGGEIYKGVDIVRDTVRLAELSGLVGDHYTQEDKNSIFVALTYAVSNEGLTTNSPGKGFRLESMPGTMENFSLLEIGHARSLVPRKDLEGITEKGISILESPQGPDIMQEMGYQVLRIKGSHDLYFQPAIKPV